MAEVELKGITKTYEGANVATLEALNLTVQSGEFMVLVGPSGCGKSTTLRMIAGLEELTDGEIWIGGKRVDELEPRDRDIAMVFQNYALYPHMTVAENMSFGLRLAKTPKAEIRKKVEAAADILGITQLLDRRPKALSGGQRQRVAMGRAIVRDPKVFLFDEPLSNLDAQLRGHMRAEIRRMQRRLKATTIYVTHDQVEAMTLADRVVVMKGGHIEQQGTPQELYGAPATRFVAGFIGSPSMNFLPATIGEGGTLTFDDSGIAPLTPAPQVASRLAPAAGRKVELGVRPEHLEASGTPDLTLPVELAEPLGATTLVHLALGSGTLVASLPPESAATEGSAQPLRLPREKLSVFDVETGQAL